jgi:DNA-directed RNA polymerase subunit L
MEQKVGEVIDKEVETIIEEKKIKKEKNVQYVFVLDSFFERDFVDPEEILDKNKGKVDRESRVYVCLKIEWETNTFLIPLRRDIGSLLEHPKLKKACYPVPSTTKEKAGLDFRKIIIVNDESLYRVDEAKISAKQRNIIQRNFDEIKSLAIAYIEGFKKAAKKNRQKRDVLYKFSALNNFLEELGISNSLEDKD